MMMNFGSKYSFADEEEKDTSRTKQEAPNRKSEIPRIMNKSQFLGIHRRLISLNLFY